MKLKTLTIENFLSIKKATLELDNAGLVLVQGVNDDDSAFDSNGAGKSTVFEAITYALFEKTVRGLKSDEIINEDAKKNTKVTLTLDDEGTLYEIQRYRKHKEHKNNTFMYKDGKNVSGKSSKDSNALIETLIGMDYSTFTNSILFGQGVVKLFSMATDREKKEILEKMLSMDVFNAALDIAKRKQKEAHNAQTALERTMADTATKLENALSNLKYFEERQRSHQDETNARIAKLEADKASKEKALRESESPDEYTQLIEHINTMETDAHEKLNGIQTQLNAKTQLQNELNTLRTDKAFAERLVKSETENLAKLKHEHDELEAGVGSNCPTCGNTVQKDNIVGASTVLLDKMKEALQTVNTQSETVGAAGAKIEAIEKQLDAFKELEEEKQANQDEAAGLRDKRAHLDARRTVIENERRTLQQAIDTLDADIETAKGELGKGFTDMIAEQETLRDTLQAEQADQDAEQKTIIQQLGELDFWVEGFGNSGIKSYLLDSVTPYLNTRANHYLSKLAGSTTEIEFSTQTRLKSGEVRDKFEVRIDNKVGGTSYDSNSTGERKRIDLAISLALQDLVMTRSSGRFNILLYDEVFDGLDAVGCENAISLLKEIQEGVPSVFVITHNDVLKSYFDNVLTVTKRDGETTLSTIK